MAGYMRRVSTAGLSCANAWALRLQVRLNHFQPRALHVSRLFCNSLRYTACTTIGPLPHRASDSTLVQAAELTQHGGVVAAADTTRIDSGACGAI